MNKTVNINLGGIGFTIDEDAYQLLDQYLRSLNEVCSTAGEPETAEDIEQRIAEILYERYGGRGIVGFSDIQSIISRIGEPEEIVEMDSSGESGPTPAGVTGRNAAASTAPPPIPHARKRLFRDPRNKMLGGVCSGLAWYFGMDPVWVRLIFVALCFLSASTIVIVYVILWIVVPEAVTPTEQLQMMGMESSVSNVGRVVTDTVPPHYTESQQGSGKRFASTLTEIFGWLAKGLFALLAVCGILVAGTILLGLAIGLIVSLTALFLPSTRFSPELSPVQLRLTLGCVFGGILVLGIPLGLAVRSLYQILSHSRTRMTGSMRIGLLITWIVGFGLLIACGTMLDVQSAPLPEVIINGLPQS